MNEEEITYRTCSSCKIPKPLTEEFFYKDRKWFRHICKICSKTKAKKVSRNFSNRTISEIIIPETKLCPKCKIIRSSKEFFKNKCKKDGLNSCCKECYYEIIHSKYGGKEGWKKKLYQYKGGRKGWNEYYRNRRKRFSKEVKTEPTSIMLGEGEFTYYPTVEESKLNPMDFFPKSEDMKLVFTSEKTTNKSAIEEEEKKE